MRISTLVTTTTAVLLGLAGAAFGYQQLAPAGSDPAPAAVAEPTAERATTVKVRFKECPKGFEQRKDECVRVVKRTVVARAAGSSTLVAGPTSPSVGSDSVDSDSGGSDSVGSLGDTSGDGFEDFDDNGHEGTGGHDDDGQDGDDDHADDDEADDDGRDDGRDDDHVDEDDHDDEDFEQDD